MAKQAAVKKAPAKEAPAKKATAKKAAAKPKDTERYDASAHPLRKEIEAVRRIMRGVSSAISEGVKWNAPSFRTEKEWFATVNLRSPETLQLIFHLGAKVRPDLKAFKVADPNGLMKWLGPDRAMVTLGAGRDIVANRKAFEAIVRAWMKHV